MTGSRRLPCSAERRRQVRQATVSRELSRCAWVRIPGYPGALCLTDAGSRAIAPGWAPSGRMSNENAQFELFQIQSERTGRRRQSSETRSTPWQKPDGRIATQRSERSTSRLLARTLGEPATRKPHRRRSQSCCRLAKHSGRYESNSRTWCWSSLKQGTQQQSSLDLRPGGPFGGSI